MIAVSTAEAARPRVVAPPGWTVSATELVPPGGTAPVSVRRLPGGPGATLDELAETERARLAAELPGFAEDSLERRSTRRGEVLVRSYSWEANGSRRRGRQLIGAGGAAATFDEGMLPDAALDNLAQAIAGFAFHAPDGVSGTYSVEELTALAELAGADSFPGTGPHRFESDRERAAALRALLARGTLRPGDQGAPRMEPLDERTVRTALQPDVALDVRVGPRRCAVYVGGELAVAHSAGAQGVHKLEPLPTALLGGALRAICGLAGGATAAASDGRVAVLGGADVAEVTWSAGDDAGEVAGRLDALAAALRGASG
jgi:hypothetical protein